MVNVIVSKNFVKNGVQLLIKYGEISAVKKVMHFIAEMPAELKSNIPLLQKLSKMQGEYIKSCEGEFDQSEGVWKIFTNKNAVEISFVYEGKHNLIISKKLIFYPLDCAQIREQDDSARFSKDNYALASTFAKFYDTTCIKGKKTTQQYEFNLVHRADGDYVLSNNQIKTSFQTQMPIRNFVANNTKNESNLEK